MGSDERRSARANVILTATLEAGGASFPVRLSNLSEHGALAVGDGLPAGDTPAILRCHGIVIGCWIAWSRAGRAGIQFEHPVSPETLTQREAAPPSMIVKDTREIDFRRPGFHGNQMTDEERKIVEEWNRPEPKRPGDDEPSSDS